MQSPAPADLAARLSARPQVARLLEALADVPNAHLVGGAVRDVLLELEPEPEPANLDLDVVVEGDAAEVARRAAERLDGSVRIHDRFNTATVTAAELAFDVAGARRERYARPGALPDVEPATLDEDLGRRDFTVNALAVALGGSEPGALRAVAGALDDLTQRRLRVLHDASFSDDPTRLLRLVRYAARLRFEIDEHTRALAERAVADGALRTVSGARIGAELRLLLGERTSLDALRLLAELGLDRALHPNFAANAEVVERARALLPADGRPDLLALAVCAAGFDRGALGEWLNALELAAPERDIVIAAALEAHPLADSLHAAERPSELAAAAHGRPLEQVAHAGALGAEGAEDAARRWLEELRHVGLEISGDDLVAAGVPEGPDVGRGLRAALDAKLDGEASGRDAELAAALRALEP